MKKALFTEKSTECPFSDIKDSYTEMDIDDIVDENDLSADLNQLHKAN